MIDGICCPSLVVKNVLAPKGALIDEVVGDNWTTEEHSEILGWTIQHDGGINIGWNRMVHKMWQAFYGNVRAAGWRKLGTRRRLLLLSRSVSGLVQRGVAIFPPQHGYALRLDCLQRRMVSAAIGNTRLATEDCVTFVRRSGRTSAAYIESHSQ